MWMLRISASRPHHSLVPHSLPCVSPLRLKEGLAASSPLPPHSLPCVCPLRLKEGLAAEDPLTWDLLMALALIDGLAGDGGDLWQAGGEGPGGGGWGHHILWRQIAAGNRGRGSGGWGQLVAGRSRGRFRGMDDADVV